MSLKEEKGQQQIGSEERLSQFSHHVPQDSKVEQNEKAKQKAGHWRKRNHFPLPGKDGGKGRENPYILLAVPYSHPFFTKEIAGMEGRSYNRIYVKDRGFGLLITTSFLNERRSYR